jgi:hypothetical protein
MRSLDPTHRPTHPKTSRMNLRSRRDRGESPGHGGRSGYSRQGGDLQRQNRPVPSLERQDSARSGKSSFFLVASDGRFRFLHMDPSRNLPDRDPQGREILYNNLRHPKGTRCDQKRGVATGAGSASMLSQGSAVELGDDPKRSMNALRWCARTRLPGLGKHGNVPVRTQGFALSRQGVYPE